MRRLRVALVLPGFAATEDEPGMPAVVDLVRALATWHDVRVIALRHPPARAPYEIAGATVRTLGLAGTHGPAGRARVLARGVRAVLQEHRRAPLDVVHGLWTDEAGAVAAVAGRLLRRPSIVSLMGGELVALPDIGYGAALGRGGRWSTAIALRLGTVATAASTAGRAALAARHTRVEAMPLGVDIGAFRPREAGAGGTLPLILFAGSLEAVKDPALLLRAVALLVPAFPGLRVELAADGSLRADLERLAGHLGVAERVRFAGALSRSALAARYRDASLLAVTSRHEAQSMVAVEAAASGIPVVGTNVGILPDLGDGAVTVPGREPAALAEALARVLGDPAVAARTGAAGRRVVEARFALPATAAATSDLYARLVARR